MAYWIKSTTNQGEPKEQEEEGALQQRGSPQVSPSLQPAVRGHVVTIKEELERLREQVENLE